MDAAYVFRVRFVLDPADPEVSVEPERFETILRKRATPPGEEGWLFFRDNLWRGEANDEVHLRDLAEGMLGVEVVSVDFRELRTDEAYLEELRGAVADDLDAFRAEGVEEVLHKYLGSSIRVVDTG